jgi:hypothetical protein
MDESQLVLIPARAGGYQVIRREDSGYKTLAQISLARSITNQNYVFWGTFLRKKDNPFKYEPVSKENLQNALYEKASTLLKEIAQKNGLHPEDLTLPKKKSELEALLANLRFAGFIRALQ